MFDSLGKCGTILGMAIILLIQINSSKSLKCVQTHPCRCQFDNGTVIDISPVVNTTAPVPQFNFTSYRSYYTYTPCSSNGFQCGNTANVSLCQNNQSSLGSASSEVMSYDSYQDLIQLKYTYGGFYAYTTYVYVVCSSSDVPYMNYTNYQYQLYTKYACPPSLGLSGGYLILIIFGALIFILVSFGLLFHVCTKMRR